MFYDAPEAEGSLIFVEQKSVTAMDAAPHRLSASCCANLELPVIAVTLPAAFFCVCVCGPSSGRNGHTEHPGG